MHLVDEHRSAPVHGIPSPLLVDLGVDRPILFFPALLLFFFLPIVRPVLLGS